MKYLNIPTKRFSILEKKTDLDMCSDVDRMDNFNNFSKVNQKHEILSENNERDEKEVNIRDIIEKAKSLDHSERLFSAKQWLKFIKK